MSGEGQYADLQDLFKMPEQEPAKTKTEWSKPRFGFYGGLAGFLCYGIPGWLGLGLIGKIIDQGITSMREEYQARKASSLRDDPMIKAFYAENNIPTSPLQLVAGTCWNRAWLSNYKKPAPKIVYDPNTDTNKYLKAYQDWTNRFNASNHPAA